MFDFVHADEITITKNTGNVIVGNLTKKLSFSRYEQKNAIAVRCESLNAFFTLLEEDMPTAQKGGESDGKKGGYSDFYTLNSYKEALETYRDAPHKVRNFTPKDDHLKAPEGIGTDIFYDVTGDFIDMGRHLEGAPEEFGNMFMGNPYTLFATVVVNLSATWNFTEEAVRIRGERLVRLIDWLESQHIRTNIIGFHSNQCDHLEIVVKRHNEPLNVDAVAAIGHTDFLRRLIFRVIEYSPTFEYGYGTATQMADGRLDMPQIEYNGMLIFSETHKDIVKIHKNFDEVETKIDTMLQAGDRQFSLAI